MEANEDAKKDIASQHCSPHWRKGATKSAGNKKAAKNIHGLSAEKQREADYHKFLADHKDLIDDDPFFPANEGPSNE